MSNDLCFLNGCNGLDCFAKVGVVLLGGIFGGLYIAFGTDFAWNLNVSVTSGGGVTYKNMVVTIEMIPKKDQPSVWQM